MWPSTQRNCLLLLAGAALLGWIGSLELAPNPSSPTCGLSRALRIMQTLESVEREAAGVREVSVAGRSPVGARCEPPRLSAAVARIPVIWSVRAIPLVSAT